MRSIGDIIQRPARTEPRLLTLDVQKTEEFHPLFAAVQLKKKKMLVGTFHILFKRRQKQGQQWAGPTVGVCVAAKLRAGRGWAIHALCDITSGSFTLSYKWGGCTFSACRERRRLSLDLFKILRPLNRGSFHRRVARSFQVWRRQSDQLKPTGPSLSSCLLPSNLTNDGPA